MTITDYLLIPLILFTILLYPLLRKIVSLLEIFVTKYVQKTSGKQMPDKQDNVQTTTQTLLNLKLLAYERIILFIERMKPDSLIPRTLSPALKSKEYQILLINEIRREFEYNLSQQLYLSEDAWMATTSFKDNIITLINTASSNCEPDHSATELAKKILGQYISSDIKIEQILQVIKKDLR